MSERHAFQVLFLCTGNSARSIMAEATLADLGAGRFKAYSAGSHPTGSPHPMALQVLGEQAHSVEGLQSKSWDEFSGPGSPDLDLVITVCDNAKSEACPIWPGGPMTAHWGVEDPAAFEGDYEGQHDAFFRVYGVLRRRIEGLLDLAEDPASLVNLRDSVQELGQRP